MEKKLINIDEVAKAIGVPTKEVEMMGRKMNMTVWSPEYTEALAERVKAEAGGGPVTLTGPGDHWALAAAGAALGDSFVEYMAGAGPTEMDLLPMGEENPEGGVHFITQEEGDRLYVFFDPDDHTKPSPMGPHNYDIAKLPKVVVPPCRPDQDVFFECGGGYGILLKILKPYFGKACRSLSVSPGHGSDFGYVCVMTNGGGLKLGDVTPYRTLG